MPLVAETAALIITVCPDKKRIESTQWCLTPVNPEEEG